jgi:hypothetical protein
VNVAVLTVDGVAIVDLEDESLVTLSDGGEFEQPPPVSVSLPRVRAAAAAGSTVVAVVDAKPPLMVSHDAGSTWRDSGRGLPAGVAVAIAPDDPDLVVYATASRLYLSRDGARFWRSLAVELPEILAVAF